MLKSIALLCILNGVLGATTRNITVPRLDGRIVGGEAAQIEDYPYQVSLEYGGGHICGGSIINSYHVLTAAHCMEYYIPYYRVRAGTAYRQTDGSLHSVYSVAIHTDYDPDTFNNDVAIIRVIEPFDYDESRQPIALAVRGYIPNDGENSVVTGWGTPFYGGNVVNVLQFVEVPIVENDVCKDRYALMNDITDSMLCAGYTEGGRDACQGDSGGPLVAAGVQVGIVSWGEGCAYPLYPGVYASVGYLRSWIDANSGI